MRAQAGARNVRLTQPSEHDVKSMRCLAHCLAVPAFAALPLASGLALDVKGEPCPMDFTDDGKTWAAAYGIVELVEPVLLDKGIPGLTDVFEHTVRPETGERVLIRLDGGHSVTVFEEGMQRFQPGQRVRVVSSGCRRRVEQE